MISPFFNWLNQAQQRKLAIKKCKDPVLSAYLQAPLPDIESTINNAEIASLDFETTGLSAKQDKLLSIGLVQIKNGKIDLSTCWHQVINVEQELKNDNVIIHQITDSEKARGILLKQAFDRLLPKLAGKVILVHFAKIEREFLQQACVQLYGTKAPFIIIDTLEIARRYYDKQNQPYDPSQLRLNNLRNNFSLPAHPAHNALSDAIATAELFLAILSHWHQGRYTTVKLVL